MAPPPIKPSFRTLYCRHHACGLDEYDRRLFRSCLHRHALPLAALLRRLNPLFFREDLDLIRDVGSATSRGEVICELNRFYGRNMRDKNWLRKAFALRLSGKRVLRLYRQLLRHASADVVSVSAEADASTRSA